MRVLFLRPDHLGDLLLTFPAVCALRRAIPSACIGFLLPEGLEDAARLCPAVDRVHTARLPDLTQPLCLEQWEKTAIPIGRTLESQYDVALLPRPDDPWTAPIAAAAGIPFRIGFDQARTGPYLTERLPLPAYCHVVRLSFDVVNAALRSFGLPCVASDLSRSGCITVHEERRVEADRALEQVKGQTGPRPIVIHPGSGWPIKNWPPSRWGHLARLLRRRFGVSPLVLGGPDERGLVRAVLESAPGAAVTLDALLSVSGLSALHARALLVIAADSGPLHLAALIGTPVLGLYGPADPAQFAPLSSPGQSRIVRVPLPCSPCGTLLHPPCGAASNPACITGIGVGAVLEAATELAGAAMATR